jgi:hypothetical protein
VAFDLIGNTTFFMPWLARSLGRGAASVLSRGTEQIDGKFYRENEKERTLLVRANHMLAVAGVWKKKRDDLKTKRNSLFEKYAKHPEEFHLALEIKKIDDEIADCTQHVEQERRSERSASTVKKLQSIPK